MFKKKQEDRSSEWNTPERVFRRQLDSPKTSSPAKGSNRMRGVLNAFRLGLDACVHAARDARNSCTKCDTTPGTRFTCVPP